MAVLAEYNANDDLQAEYIYGIDGMLTKFAPNQGHTWYYKDHLGSTREMGNTTMLRDYYPFGETLNAAGDETNYQFTGKELDNHTEGDLYYFGARYYDPKIGRFLSCDPLAEKAPDMTPYHYAHNNPSNRFDPDGNADFKSSAKLKIEALKVINKSYLQPKQNSKGIITQTYCNFGVRDILNAGDDFTLDNMKANDMFDFLSNEDNASKITYKDAVKYANEGISVILAAKSESGSGHVAVVAPEEMVRSGSWDKKVPQVFNVGKQNKIMGANYAFKKSNQPTAFILNQDKEAADTRILSRNMPSYDDMIKHLEELISATKIDFDKLK